MNNTGYFEMLIKITNLSMLNSTMNLIKLKRPSFELVWSSFALKFNNFTDPLNTFIDSTHGYFLNNIVSTSEVTITPMIIIDNNPLNSKEMNPFQIGTNQPDGAEFFISKETIINEDVFDRSISTANDENLIFKRYRFRLSSQRREIYRYRTNIYDFLANISAFTAFILLFLTLLMNSINDMFAKKYLFRLLFSFKNFENILKFKHDFLIQDKEDKENEKMKKRIKSKSSVYFKSGSKQDLLFNTSRSILNFNFR